MLNIFQETGLSREKIKQKAKDYFGKKGLKLEVIEDEEDCINFCGEGGGGFINITISKQEKKNKVEIETSEWEYQVKEFLSKL